MTNVLILYWNLVSFNFGQICFDHNTQVKFNFVNNMVYGFSVMTLFTFTGSRDICVRWTVLICFNHSFFFAKKNKLCFSHYKHLMLQNVFGMWRSSYPSEKNYFDESIYNSTPCNRWINAVTVLYITLILTQEVHNKALNKLRATEKSFECLFS